MRTNHLIASLLIGFSMMGGVVFTQADNGPDILQPVRLYPAVGDETVFFKTVPEVVVDDQENVYALDNMNMTIYKMSREGKHIKNIGQRGEGPGDLKWPTHIRIKGDRLFVIDSVALSVFSTDGRFIQRFRVFNRIEHFDFLGENLVLNEFSNDGLFRLYTCEGKRLLSFGKKYSIDYGLFKGYSQYEIDGTVNTGKVLGDGENTYFLSYVFGEIFKFDAGGNLVKKVKLDGLDNKIITRNIRYFFIDGAKREKRVRDNLGYFAPVSDAAYLDNAIYVLTSNPEYWLIVAYDRNQFNIQGRYRLSPLGKDTAAPVNLYLCRKGAEIFFYISFYRGRRDSFITMYTIKRRK